MKTQSLLLIFLLFLLPVFSIAADNSVSQASDELSDFMVVPDNYVAADTAVYTLSFNIDKK